MIETFVAVVDRAIDLVRHRSASRRATFLDQVEPVFADLLLIHDDYRNLFIEIQSQANTEWMPADKERLAGLIAQRRRQLALMRQKVVVLSEELGHTAGLPLAATMFFLNVRDYFRASSGDGERWSSAATTLVEAFDAFDRAPINKQEALSFAISEVASNLERRWDEILKSYARARASLLKN